MHCLRRLAWASACVLAVARPVSAAPPADIVPLRVPAGRVHAVLTGAFTSPPRREIVLAADQRNGAGPPHKWFHVFAAHAGTGGEPHAPVITLALPPGAALAQCGDLNGDGREELTFLARDGVYAFRTEGDGPAGPARRVLARPVLVPPATDRVARGTYLVDLNGDGRLDLLLPVEDGLAFHAQKDGGAFAPEPDALLAFPVTARISGRGAQPLVMYRLPEVAVHDFNKDGRLDVAVLDLAGSFWFLQRGDGTFAAKRLAGDLSPDADIQFTLAQFGDWNRDGRPDATVTRYEQRRVMSTTVDVYLGGPDGPFGAQPALTLDRPSTLVFPLFLDVSGNGRSELLVYSVHFGLRFALNYFLRDMIAVDVDLYPVRTDGTFAPEPTVHHTISVEAFNSGAEPARVPADVNGDGATDMVVGLGERRLGVFLGGGPEGIAARPAWTVAVEAYGRGYAEDLDGDGRDDVVLTYPEPERQRRATVLLWRPAVAASAPLVE